MKSNKDIITTVLGGVIGAGVAAQPVVNAVEGSFHTADFVRLFVALAIWANGYFTNKGSHSGE